MKISYIGMKAQEVSIKPGTMKIVMQPDAEVLDEVVVTGMTKSRQASFYWCGRSFDSGKCKGWMVCLILAVDWKAGLPAYLFKTYPVPLVQPLKSGFVVPRQFMVIPNHCG